jgi:hypothetical protein
MHTGMGRGVMEEAEGAVVAHFLHRGSPSNRCWGRTSSGMYTCLLLSIIFITGYTAKNSVHEVGPGG